MAYRLYWADGGRILWSDPFDEPPLRSAYTHGGAGWSWVATDARSNDARQAGYATMSLTVSCNHPAVVQFDIFSSVPDREGGYPGRGYLAFEVDGVEQARWVSSETWRKVRFPIRAGNRQLTWRWVDVDRSGGWAAIDDLLVREYAPIPGVYHVAFYTPPRPLRPAVVHQPLEGPPMVQVVSLHGGSVADMAIAAVGPDNYSRIIAGLHKRQPLVWLDEGDRLWLGTVGDEFEVEQHGWLYLIRVQLLLQQAPGVGAP